MKKIVFNLIVSMWLVIGTVTAQDNKFVQAMVAQLERAKTAQTIVDYQNLANGFERIARAEKNQWTPFYYAAYYNIMINFQESDPAIKQQYLNKGMGLIEEGLKVEPNESELLVIKVLGLYGQMALDPMKAMELFPITNELLDMAKSNNPNNPRIYLIQAEAILNMPVEFGGGIDKAKTVLVMAKEKFDQFNPESQIHPNWGYERCEMLLRQS